MYTFSANKNNNFMFKHISSCFKHSFHIFAVKHVMFKV